MASELDQAIQAGLVLIREISGLRNAPDYSPEHPNVFPLLVGSANAGVWIKESSGQVRGLHTIKFGIFKPRNNLPRDIAAMMPYGELVKDKLYHDDSETWGGTITGYDDEPINYTFGEMEYMPGVTLIGWTFLVPVKIRSVQSGSGYVKG